MTKVLSPEYTRDLLIDRVEMLEKLPTFREPTPQMYEWFSLALGAGMANSHRTNRGKREIATDLNMNVSELEALFIGKSVLDIGCGQGKFSNEIAMLKKTTVTALDHNTEVMSPLKEAKNLRKINGSGFDLQGTLGDEQFDIVVSAYSSVHWAKTAEEKQTAINSALRACKIGGKVLFIPIMADLEHKEANRRALEVGIVRGTRGIATAEEVEGNKMSMHVMDWLEVTALDMLLAKEVPGDIECTFVSSRDNDRDIPIARTLSDAGQPRQERYSAVVDVLNKI